MSPKTERTALAKLTALGGELAESCAREVRTANREAEKANRPSSATQPAPK
jgi:hypothetical protein